MYVPDKLTPLTPDEAIAALAAAYRRVLGVEVDAPTLAILTAQTALETGQWKSLHWFNWGNVKRGHWPGMYTMFSCTEVYPAAEAQRQVATAKQRADGHGLDAAITNHYSNGDCVVRFWPAHKQTEFRAYDTAADGAAAYITFLAVDTTPNNGKPNRYAAAWAAADVADDPVLFVTEARRAGYFTADVTSYSHSVLQLYRQFMPKCVECVQTRAHMQFDDAPDSQPTIPDTPSGIDEARVKSQVAGTLAGEVREFFGGDDDPKGAA